MNSDRPASRTSPANGSSPDSPALTSFASEATLPPPPARVQPPNPLAEFPQERSSAAGKHYGVRRRLYAAGAAVFVAAIAAVSWRVSPSSTGPAAGNVPEQAVAAPSPAVAPPIEARNDVSVPITPTVSVKPSARTPIARVVATVGREEADRASNPAPRRVALSAAVVQQRQAEERANLARRPASASVAEPPRPAPAAPSPRLAEPRSADPSPQPPMVAANSPARAPAPPPALTPTPPPAAAVDVAPTAPTVSTQPAPVRLAPPEALPSVVARNEQSEIQRTLGQYRNAYQSLDAEAARAVWPSVDVRALSRAFDTLTSQELAFDTCLYEIAGQAATAQCRGSATYTPKVGSRAAKVEARQWTFHLRKLDEGWKIESAQARR